MLTSPFDLTFDATFQGLLPPVSAVAVPVCQLPGTHLMWLSACGWAYYLFSGNADTDSVVASAGEFVQAGLSQDSQKTRQRVRTIRAGGLTQADSEVVAGAFESPRVFVLQPGKNNLILAVPVRIEPGTLAIWRDSRSRIGLELKLVFPGRDSQRV